MKLQPMQTDTFTGWHQISKPIVTNIAAPRIFETFVSLHCAIETWELISISISIISIKFLAQNDSQFDMKKET